MNLELSLKTQNIRSLSLGETGLVSMRKKVRAAILADDEREFLFGGKKTL